MTSWPENEGGGSASRTGPKRPTRALNSEFVDIQKLHHLMRKLAQCHPSERIRTNALNIQALEDSYSVEQLNIEHALQLNCIFR